MCLRSTCTDSRIITESFLFLQAGTLGHTSWWTCCRLSTDPNKGEIVWVTVASPSTAWSGGTDNKGTELSEGEKRRNHYYRLGYNWMSKAPEIYVPKVKL